MKRRMALRLAAGTALGAVRPALAQGQRVMRVGVLGIMPAYDSPVSTAHWQSVLDELKQRGWEEGRNLIVERRYSMGDQKKHYTNAVELVAAHVDVIVAFGHERLAPAYQATRTVPIVTMGSGLVELGYAKSLAQPGGNVTGVEFQGRAFAGKHFQLLYGTRSGLKRIGYAGNPGINTYASIAPLQDAASTKGVAVVRLPDLQGVADVERMLAAAKREAVQVLALGSGMFFLLGQGVRRIQAWASENKVITSSPNWQRGELLFAYGPELQELSQMAWNAVDRILRGARPAEFPIQQPTRYDVAISMKIARAMGIVVPQAILLEATEVIE